VNLPSSIEGVQRQTRPRIARRMDAAEAGRTGLLTRSTILLCLKKDEKEDILVTMNLRSQRIRGRFPLFTNCREGLFSETRMQSGEALFTRTGTKSTYGTVTHITLPQDVVVLHKVAGISLYRGYLVLYAADMAQSNGDVPPGISKLPVPEAAEALGISPEAVRNRLSRGTLKSVKERGRVFVLIDRDMVRDNNDMSGGTSRDTDDIPTDTPPESAALIDAKDETIRILEEQLESERAASAELRRIVAGLVQRVPELEPAREAPPEGRESTVSASGDAGEGDVPPAPEKRSFWQKLFGT
jgi:hypothetical protein